MIEEWEGTMITLTVCDLQFNKEKLISNVTLIFLEHMCVHRNVRLAELSAIWGSCKFTEIIILNHIIPHNAIINI